MRRRRSSSPRRRSTRRPVARRAPHREPTATRTEVQAEIVFDEEPDATRVARCDAVARSRAAAAMATHADIFADSAGERPATSRREKSGDPSCDRPYVVRWTRRATLLQPFFVCSDPAGALHLADGRRPGAPTAPPARPSDQATPLFAIPCRAATSERALPVTDRVSRPARIVRSAANRRTTTRRTRGPAERERSRTSSRPTNAVARSAAHSEARSALRSITGDSL